MDREALSIIRSRVEPHKIDRKEKKVVKVHHFTYKSPLSFAESEELGIGQLRWYGPCLRCSVRAVGMTAREHAELNLIEANIKLYLETATTTFQYPVIGDLSKLSDNQLNITP